MGGVIETARKGLCLRLSDDFTLAGMVARIQRTVLPCDRVKGSISMLRVVQHK